MIGAIIGDLAGSEYEWSECKFKSTLLPFLFQRPSFTDDTVMTLAVADALMTYDDVMGPDPNAWLNEEDGRDLDLFRKLLIEKMRLYESKYHRGCGEHCSLCLDREEELPYYSCGNGAAMRVSPIGLYASSLENALFLAEVSASVTHNHPEGIKGAQVVVGAVYLAKSGATRDEIRQFVANYYDIDFTLDQIRPDYKFDETCQGTVPQAMVSFLESDDLFDTLRNAISLGGDSDTLAAIAGAVAEQFYGIDESMRDHLLSYISKDLQEIVSDFYRRYM